MAALKEQDLRVLQRQLQERQEALRAEVKSAREEEAERPSAIVPNQQADAGEQGEEHIRGAVRYAEQERDLLELRDIEEAQERIAAGTYGQCVDCGADIPLPRLQAQPTAKRCIACQEKFEQKHPPGPRFAPGL